MAVFVRFSNKMSPHLSEVCQKLHFQKVFEYSVSCPRLSMSNERSSLVPVFTIESGYKSELESDETLPIKKCLLYSEAALKIRDIWSDIKSKWGNESETGALSKLCLLLMTMEMIADSVQGNNKAWVPSKNNVYWKTTTIITIPWSKRA